MKVFIAIGLLLVSAALSAEDTFTKNGAFERVEGRKLVQALEPTVLEALVYAATVPLPLEVPTPPLGNLSLGHSDS